MTALASFGGSARAIHFFMEGDFLMEQLQPCILWRIFFIYLYLYRYLFWQENLQSSIVWVILSAVGTIIISYNTQLSILSTVMCIFLTLKLQRSNLANAFSFSLFQNTSHRETNRSSYISRAVSNIIRWEQPLEAVTFSQRDLFSE